MLPERFISDSGSTGIGWEELGVGAPTIIGFARLCSNSLASGVINTDGLSEEAKAILFTAHGRGVIEIKASSNAFDATDRFLAVSVETDPDTAVVFKNKNEPEKTVRYLDAFRELCAAGLIMHHLFREFSLSDAGFQAANTLKREEIEDALSFGVELARHEW